MKKIICLFLVLLCVVSITNAQIVVIDNHSSNPPSQVIETDLNNEFDAGTVASFRIRYFPSTEPVMEALCECQTELYKVGDLNHNGIVNTSDLLIMVGVFGTTYTTTPSCNQFLGDAILEELKFGLKSSLDQEAGLLFDQLILLINGEVVDSQSIDNEQSEVFFDDIDFEFSYEEDLVITLQASLEAQGNFPQGTNFSIDIYSVQVDDENGSTVGDVVFKEGTKGNTMYLYSSGIKEVQLISQEVIQTLNEETGGTQASFKINFSVESFGDDVFIPDIVNQNGFLHITLEEYVDQHPYVMSVPTMTSLSGAEDVGPFFKIEEGHVETFEIVCTLTPLEDGYFGVTVLSLPFGLSDDTLGIYYYPYWLLSPVINTNSVFLVTGN